MIELTPAQRRELRAKAHHLNPVVTIAGNGLTPSVIAELERSLQAHELIKVRVQGAEREQRDALMNELCTTLNASPVQHIGNILVVWRERREEDKAAAEPLQKRSSKAATAKSAAAFAAAARRAALAKAASETRRPPARASSGRIRGTGRGR
ncbi:MAG: ribosome assembly RNA-binding protein YhbY [Betaproteobacteria bacterium]|nr:MAG: ribosome assembly RNA-binding protein YhbY [Betaproteobacteria bacterium]